MVGMETQKWGKGDLEENGGNKRFILIKKHSFLKGMG